MVQTVARQAQELARQADFGTTEDVARGLEEHLTAALTDSAVAE